MFSPERNVIWKQLLLLIGVHTVLGIDIRMNPTVFGVVGESVKLKCSFSSSYPISDLVTVDWSYRLQEGGPTVTILHFQSKPYPILDGPFKDRITWEGDIGRGDASVSLKDLRLSDNGTLSCAVRNPPDVHGSVPQTKLTVTIQSVYFKFSTVILLSALVFIPSALVCLLLLVRMRRAIKRERKTNLIKSPIEVSQECVYSDSARTPLHCTAPTEHPPGCLVRYCQKCLDVSEEEY
ncbi:hypothetical protein GDO86_012784 [Hymenochirus boettgeri]|uniref:Myelin protein P0 n=1 Tax=Hymenochirus boettgeri TaxID=247094 RepID=A0A8T2INJ0_9PIPI|nr:hypothetical protein GDO86_012784 [Hymenochirus boettgeri]